MLLWINPRYQAALEAHGVDPYDAVARLRPADDLVEKQGRSTARYLIDHEGEQVGIYLKKYPRIPWWTRNWSPETEFPGPREWTRMLEVRELGIRTAEPVVAGADRKHDCKSILATRELAGYQELHKFIPRKFAAPLTQEAWEFKQRLIARLAATARRMHEARLFHLDFYLCHFFIREDAREPDGFDLVLIDLLRLTRSRRSRWQVKDLAQFLFSSDLPGIAPEDRMQFFKLYVGADRLSGADRRLLLRVQWKAWIYHRHNRSAEAREPRAAA